jgi:hypothetical protein
MTTGQSARICFEINERAAIIPCSVSLPDAKAYALAHLVPLLGCGEEAAALGFDRLGECDKLGNVARQSLQDIAREERAHDALMRGLQVALPRITVDAPKMRAIRRYHHAMARGSALTHLARIAGLDAAVCLIMSRLVKPGTPIAADAGIRPMIARIRSDESRHVMISRRLVVAANNRRTMRDFAAEARAGLANLIMGGADAFEALSVDPDQLDRDVRRLPDGLLPA